VIAHLTACGLPARISDLPRRFTADALLGRMAKDKKNRDGKMRFVLLRGPR
jgi:shikimate kinase/3-dehydroquinate synthase